MHAIVVQNDFNVLIDVLYFYMANIPSNIVYVSC